MVHHTLAIIISKNNIKFLKLNKLYGTQHEKICRCRWSLPVPSEASRRNVFEFKIGTEITVNSQVSLMFCSEIVFLDNPKI